MFRGMLRTIRPHQWVKNLFVVAPIVFGRAVDDVSAVVNTALAFVAFSMAASSVYVLNDLTDIEADRAHPVKCKRPIPSGVISVNLARGMLVVMVLIALSISFYLNLYVMGTIVGYLLLNVAYSFRLKHIAYVDVLCIATGFELRVLCGTFAPDIPPTVWLLLLTFLLAAFLGFGKRLHELVQGEHATKQRRVLEHYNQQTLVGLLFGTAIATVSAYAAYTMDPHTRSMFGSDYLVFTTPFTLFGVMRFLWLVRNRPNSESPTEEMLKDTWFIINLLTWGATTVGIIYFA